MTKIRVLIVDDSVVVRRFLHDLLISDPVLQVGVASSGRIALARMGQFNPDVVTLDLEMPEMDGLETLAALRAQYPAVPVLMVSRHTQRGTEATLRALTLGASGCLALPESVSGLEATRDWFREQLIPRIKSLRASKTEEPSPTAAKAAGAVARPRSGLLFADLPSRLELVAIGASTGGPNALAELLGAVPCDFPVPVLIVQHMPVGFPRQLAERLSKLSALQVREALPGVVLEPGAAWIAPGNFHMVVQKNGIGLRLHLHQGSPENSCRPSVDVLFRSVAETVGAGALGVILTGMGQDGLRGCESLRDAGGQILAQDEATSVVWGMPGYVSRAGLAHQVLPLAMLGGEIVRRVRRGRSPSALKVVDAPERR